MAMSRSCWGNERCGCLRRCSMPRGFRSPGAGCCRGVTNAGIIRKAGCFGHCGRVFQVHGKPRVAGSKQPFAARAVPRSACNNRSAKITPCTVTHNGINGLAADRDVLLFFRIQLDASGKILLDRHHPETVRPELLAATRIAERGRRPAPVCIGTDERLTANVAPDA